MAAPVLEVRNLKRDYVSSGGFLRPAKVVHAVKGVNFTLEKGKTLAVVGESGCGKSTLARMITLIDPPTSGEILIDGEAVDARHVTHQMRQKVQIVFQNPYGSLNPRQKIGDVLAEPLMLNTKMSAADRRDKAMAMLVKVGLGPEHFNRYPHMFSGGQRQRVAIARALMLNPSFLVLDEPVSALDLSVQAQILNLLKDLQDEFGLTYVFISHDLSVVRYIADEVMVMYFGDVVEHGSRDAVFQNPQHEYTQTLFAATPRSDVDSIRRRLAAKAAIPA
ncbi:dipeptide ABC transporter ATP-binding protein [Devosia sp. J2-20]|jgi:dipeptide transport system ATP-binding protein|uniref:Dipeptide ABC transporter ATP-binding protein n=1 Tax=Devosia litorisediminis TaxID=2829817 RepID=A0A942E7H5_9HYPH|nr:MULTISPECIES: dipeptide ABC transporter ATP-binding protein [Devosia]MBS3849673.1 dipeptide ABC transporter ATP-binding protein [Devosia litorisediminis]MCZ4347955.1 dipeptide ABC transporter ATP-binding protein [Devosia neptuniae]WDR00431.1 dipeptide ABC transporter ATP-binding protein [Devosia sp. J2-20]|tara:strand:- start:527 stop:1357 length:831 start_codon:yes stop_codon:yes gene_type:complete